MSRLAKADKRQQCQDHRNDTSCSEAKSTLFFCDEQGLEVHEAYPHSSKEMREYQESSTPNVNKLHFVELAGAMLKRTFF